MKSKLFVAGVAMLACSAATVFAIGCSSSSETGVTSEAGAAETGTVEAGGNTEGGADAAVDAKPDGAVTGAFVTIDYAPTCPALTKCDSDVKGFWQLTGGCVSEEVFAAAKQNCAGIVESDVKFEARGNVIADALTITRNTELKFSAKFFVPKMCVDLAGGSCSTIASAIKFNGFKTATCVASATAGACDCDVANDTKDTLAAEGYTTSAGTLTTTTTNKTYDYCAMGSEIKYRETTANSIPAILTLKK